MTRFYEIIVGNIGKVHEGANREEAMKNFKLYTYMSKENLGRGAGETVTLYEDGEPIHEHTGSLNEAEIELDYPIAAKEMLKGRFLKRREWEHNGPVGYDQVRGTLYIVDAYGSAKKFVPTDEEKQASDWVYADLKLPE